MNFKHNTNISINTNNTYNHIGNNICCSSDGNIIISTINNNNYKLYVKNLIINQETLLDFQSYSLYHSSFNFSITTSTIPNNAFNAKEIYLDTNDNGSIIVVNYLYNVSSGTIQNAPFFNFYIINNFKIYFLKFKPTSLNLSNSYITSLSISGDGSRIFITTTSGYHFIFDIDFQFNIIKETNLNATTIIYYYDIEPSYYFYKKNLNYTHYRGSISKSGYIITIGNNYETLIYKLNLISNSWEEQPPILTSLNQIPLINNYGISVDKNGFSCAISYIYKLTDTNLLDTIQIKNYYYQFYENKTTFHKDKNKL